MSYETTSRLPKGISKQQAAEFAELIGYEPSGTYAHMGRPRTLSLSHFRERDYSSWNTIELSISSSGGYTTVHTRTRVGRSPYDFKKQNWTADEFKKRFGGSLTKDNGDGSGYDPGPSIPPAASGCYLAARRMKSNLSRLSTYLNIYPAPEIAEGMKRTEKIWPQMRAYNPEIFSRNVLVPYLVASMEDYLKSSYVALLRYSPNKAMLLKNARLSGDQLASIADGKISVEDAVSENKSFQNLRLIGRHFSELDPKLDILGPLRKPSGYNSLYDQLEKLVEQRHALIHRMELDLSLDTHKVKAAVMRLEKAMGKVYSELLNHYRWKRLMKPSGSENFSLI